MMAVMLRRRLQRPDAQRAPDEEPDPDEMELRAFESNCERLDSSRATSRWHWLQVEAWLLFEDTSSSPAAKWVQGSLFVLIIFSTCLILAQSWTDCKWVDAIPAGRFGYDALPACATPFNSNTSDGCFRVCRERKEPFEPGGPIAYFILDAFCIGAFTIEFLVRMLASPATVGLGVFWTTLANWIDFFAITPFFIDLAVLAVVGNGSGTKILAVLRIVRLTRVLRVLKFSKSLSGIIVLVRTVGKSGSAIMIIATFTVLNCILWASLMIASGEVT